MAEIKGKVGPYELTWNPAPRGSSGISHVKIKGREGSLEVRWKKDDQGLWIETDQGFTGFDFTTELSDDGLSRYHVLERGGSGSWSGLQFLRAGEDVLSASAHGKKKGERIRAQMPGKIIKVLVKAGADVLKDQPLVVMEAMKMENEIKAPHDARIATVKVIEGQAVESGADLLILE